MIYLKKKDMDFEFKVDIYGDEFYEKCVQCGKERQLEPEEMIEYFKINNFSGIVSVCSRECLEKLKASGKLEFSYGCEEE